MDGEKAGAVGMDGQPPPYTSPQHQANAAAGEGIAYIMSYNAVMTMSVIIILTRHTIVWKDAVCCFLFCFFVSCFLFFFLPFFVQLRIARQRRDWSAWNFAEWSFPCVFWDLEAITLGASKCEAKKLGWTIFINLNFTQYIVDSQTLIHPFDCDNLETVHLIVSFN